VPTPEPYNDLDLEAKISVLFYNMVQNDNAPDEIQDRARQYIDLVQDAVDQKQQGVMQKQAAMAGAATPPGIAGGAAPGGAPGGMPGITPGAPTGAPAPNSGGAPGLVALQGGVS
jgi:hypothetical protein